VAANDKYLRALIDNGSATANELRTFLEQNRVNLGSLINNLVTTNQVVVKHLKGIRQLMILYPYVVAGGFTVAKKNAQGKYDAQFGLILQQDSPTCNKGYNPKDRRDPHDLKDLPMNTKAGCTDGSRNHRGAEKSPSGRTGAAYRSPVATYDARTGTTTWADQDTSAKVAYDGGAAQLYGDDSWKSLFLQPALADNQE
jgi:phospholipid/cholesterol/gamma-HCH transport system substrate-binding protein